MFWSFEAARLAALETLLNLTLHMVTSGAMALDLALDGSNLTSIYVLPQCFQSDTGHEAFLIYPTPPRFPNRRQYRAPRMMCTTASYLRHTDIDKIICTPPYHATVLTKSLITPVCLCISPGGIIQASV